MTTVQTVIYLLQDDEANVLRWSLDGVRLLLLDMTAGTPTVWRPDKLP